jgi:hypothetical protein
MYCEFIKIQTYILLGISFTSDKSAEEVVASCCAKMREKKLMGFRRLDKCEDPFNYHHG